MITVSGRTLIIPLSERQIGTTYDNQAEIRTFCLSRSVPGGIDLSHLEFRIDVMLAGNTYDTCKPDKEVYDDKIILVWQIPESSVSAAGTVWVSLRGIDSSGSLKWASNKAAFYVEGSVDTPANYNGLSELEQFEIKADYAIAHSEQTLEDVKQLVAQTVTELEEKNSEILQTAETAVQNADTARLEAENTLAEASKYAADLKDYASESEAWAHGHENYPDNDTDNSKYWSGRAKDYRDKAKNEADRASAYADYVEPDFLILDNRLYVNGDSTVNFALDNNRLYFKLPA